MAIATSINTKANMNKTSRIIKNNDTKWRIQVNKSVFDDSLHYARKEKPYLERLLTDIDTVLQRAILFDTAVSKKSSGNKKGSTQFMHYLYSLVEYNGSPFLAKIAIEEYGNENNRRAYNVQRIKMSALSRAQYSQMKSAYREKFASNADVVSVADLHALVKQYDGKFNPKFVNEKFLNEDGTPKVFYHGTNAKWTKYDLSKNVNQMWGEGIYLTPYKERARLYGDNVMPFYVKADYDFRTAKLSGKTRDYTLMKKAGDVLVYSPNQIKSATDNVGTFDSNNSDIRYSIDDSFNDWLDEAVPQGIDFDKVLEINPTVALATVYRSAAKTTESGLAQSKGVDLDEKAFLLFSVLNFR